jgi:DNA-binding MarR family transcriptional regulator
MGYKPKKDLFSLLHEVNSAIGRGPRQGLSVRPGQNKVLKVLTKNNDTMRQQDLLSHLGIRAGSLSELLGKLEKDGYITRHRNEENKSEIIVDITELGRISALESEMAVDERDRELFGCLTAEEKTEVTRILNKLLEHWEQDSDETEGERRGHRWHEIATMQDIERDVRGMFEKNDQ